MDFSLGITAKDRVRFQKAFHLCLCLETARGKAFQGFFDQAGIRLIAHHHLARMAFDTLIAVACRHPEREVAIQEPCLHPVHNLLAVLLAVMLRHAGNDVFKKNAVCVFAKLNGRTFQRCSDRAKRIAQLSMNHSVTGKAGYVVNQDNRLNCPILAQPSHHGFHAGAVNQTA
ncbi:MAG: hypothetical protein ABJO52_20980 [Nisaea sp.]|uniref:hypothetical protein n=1 Tax=Nisaea sp. TaxID=2024842 RepID=UPI00329757D0